jgi:hypothetical protein
MSSDEFGRPGATHQSFGLPAFIATLVAVAIGLFVATNYSKHLRKNQPSVGDAAPETVGVDLDGKEFRLSEYRGKVVMLDFWGNW